MKAIQLQSVITCPYCGFQKEETMPEDSCQFFINAPIVVKYSNLKKVIVVCFAPMEP